MNNNKEILEEFRKYSAEFMIFYSVLIGVKKSMDLWISSKQLDSFKSFCKKYGIYYEYDIKFIKPQNNDYFKKIIGGETLTTTKVIGEDVNSKNDGTIHFFISKNKNNANELFKYGWYPVVIDNRVIYKNYQDLIEFGYALGYPRCCIKYFFEKNDWRYYNFPYEIYKKSKSYDYRCNPFWKDVGYSFIYHMPCSFSCEDTIRYTDEVIANLKKDDVDLLNEIEKKLLMPILSIREQKIYAFEGEIINENKLKYSKYYTLGNRKELDLGEYLEKGDNIEIGDKKIGLKKGNKVIYSYDFINQKDIEKPFLIKFNK